MANSAAKATFRKVHFTLGDRLTAYVSRRLFGNFTYRARHGLATGMLRTGGMGFLPSWLIRGPDRMPEVLFLRDLNVTDKVVYDIGAYEGVMTLFFSRRAKQVISFEANPDNYRKLLANIQLNHLENVQVIHCALGESRGVLTLVCDPLMSGAGSGDPAIVHQIKDSVPKAAAFQVPMVPLHDVYVSQQLPPPDLVKIDVEGMELQVLKGMGPVLSLLHPMLYLDMHGANLDEKNQKVAAIIQFLHEIGYRRILHVESKTMIDTTNSPLAREGHIFCTK